MTRLLPAADSATKSSREPLLTPAVIFELLGDQEGRCAICADQLVVAPNAVDNLTGVIDRDPATGAVRGLLCRRCHTGITSFDSDAARLHRARSYLRPDVERRSPTKGRALRSGGAGATSPRSMTVEDTPVGAVERTEAAS